MKKCFWIVVAVLAASIAMNIWFWTSEPEIETILKRDTVWRDTTIYEPQASSANCRHGSLRESRNDTAADGHKWNTNINE